MMQWIACRVTTGKEYEVRKKILNKLPDAEIFVPRKNTKEMIAGVVKIKSERMMPGYMIVGTENKFDPFLFGDFLKILGRISKEEYDTIREQEGERELNLDKGTRILVIDGPFQGCKGDIKKRHEDGSFDCRLVFQGMEICTTMRAEFLSTTN